jgi:hypothetical protein
MNLRNAFGKVMAIWGFSRQERFIRVVAPSGCQGTGVRVLKVRELQTGGKILVTTLLCVKKTPEVALKLPYQRRWGGRIQWLEYETPGFY